MTPDPSSAAAQGAAAAYRRRMTPKQMEAEVFARAARATRGAEAGTAMDRVRAGADNRRLWNAVRGAVADPSNALPPALRARIAGVAVAVVRECEAAEPDFGFVAEVNEQFAAALWG